MARCGTVLLVPWLCVAAIAAGKAKDWNGFGAGPEERVVGYLKGV